ncbi:MAG: type II toxin-antitoxin system RelE/ParE family toxin [Gammaproteobacteria bacterium]|nr:type II toxin-antitoxin system RelE/ParE family toxin [Gammaproteobacteria bacterium]
MKVIWSRRALLDVEHIRDYIAHDSPAYARPFVERLLHATRHLPQFPHSGRAMPEAKDLRIREVIYQGYRLIYRLRADTIEIVMVVHGSRDLTNPDNQPWQAPETPAK